MARMDTATRARIVNLLELGKSSREIAEEVHVSHSAVLRVRRQMCPATPRRVGGRPPKLSPSHRRALVRRVTTGKCLTATRAARELANTDNVSVSRDTVARALRQAGLRSSVRLKRPQLTAAHKRDRLAWAKAHRDWTLEDWKSVTWSDEVKINRIGSDEQHWTWRKPGESLRAHHILETEKFGGGSLMFWGCMTHAGCGYGCQIEGAVNTDVYLEVLTENLLDTIAQFELDVDHVIFQHDNAPAHQSARTRAWLADQQIEPLPWPAQSPDLNPIETRWAELKRRVGAADPPPSSVAALWEIVRAEWDKIPASVCARLVESMPERIAAVIKAKGGNTRY